MAQDYKNAASRPDPNAPAPGWIWLIAGFAMGFAAAVLLKVGGEVRKPQPTTAVETRDADGADEEKAPRFDFYKMLPNFEVILPEQDINVQRHGEVEVVDQPGTYVLQAGSFQTFSEADRLRATLALLGVESQIQKVTIDNDQTWHRVRIGPFKDLAELNDTRQRLAENGMQALVIRVGD